MVLLHLTSDMLCVSLLPVCTAGTANRLIYINIMKISTFEIDALKPVLIYSKNEV